MRDLVAGIWLFNWFLRFMVWFMVICGVVCATPFVMAGLEIRSVRRQRRELRAALQEIIGDRPDGAPAIAHLMRMHLDSCLRFVLGPIVVVTGIATAAGLPPYIGFVLASVVAWFASRGIGILKVRALVQQARTAFSARHLEAPLPVTRTDVKSELRAAASTTVTPQPDQISDAQMNLLAGERPTH